MLWHYYTRELWRKRAVIGIYAAVPSVIFLICGLAENLEGALLSLLLFLPLLSRRFRNFLCGLSLHAVYCRTCGREIPAVIFAPCEHCGFQGYRNIFSPCPRCHEYVSRIQCPTCTGHLLISREEP